MHLWFKYYIITKTKLVLCSRSSLKSKIKLITSLQASDTFYILKMAKMIIKREEFEEDMDTVAWRGEV